MSTDHISAAARARRESSPYAVSRPVVLLDVDGVLNAVPLRGRPRAWKDWRTGEAAAEGRRFPILWSPAVVSAVLAWHEVAEVQWLTTWGYDANRSLRHLLGLPELAVAGTYDGLAAAGRPDDADAHAAVAPAAPDPLTGRWWKFDVVRRLVGQDCTRRLVWIDDDLAGERDIRAWMDRETDCLLVSPDRSSGLVEAQLEKISRFLRQRG